ncbi:MAG: aldo/keto reductase [Phycisphaerae bacterium]
MLQRYFGDTDVQVSAISLGCWIFGVDWWGHYDQPDCDRMCAFAREQGVSFFDNGDAYGNGRAETLFGNWLKSQDRSQIQVGGKFGYDFATDPGTPGAHRERLQNFTPQFMRKALEDSLGRLQTDYLDVYMAHNIKLPQFSDELFAELDKVQQEGKIRCWGVSLGPAIGWREEGFRAMGDYNCKAVQTVYNLLEQHPGREFCEMARAMKAGVLARVQDNSGVLKDVITPDMKMAASDHRKFRDENWKKTGPQKVEFLRPIAERHGMTIHQLACKWLVQHAETLTSITATLQNEAEIREVCEALDKPDLSGEDLRTLHTLYENDFDLGPDAHPCDLKSSTDEAGKVPSRYVPPPVMLA